MYLASGTIRMLHDLSDDGRWQVRQMKAQQAGLQQTCSQLTAFLSYRHFLAIRQLMNYTLCSLKDASQQHAILFVPWQVLLVGSNSHISSKLSQCEAVHLDVLHKDARVEGRQSSHLSGLLNHGSGASAKKHKRGSQKCPASLTLAD